MGLLQQTPVLLSGSVRDNLLLSFRYTASDGLPRPDDRSLDGELERFLLDVDLDDDAGPLSVGQKQRLALIRTLLAKPDLLLCDEPTSALDPESRGIVQDRLERFCSEEGKTAILVTHNESPSRELSPRRLRLHDGRIIEETS